MPLPNTIVWLFTPDLQEQFEGGDLAHTDADGSNSTQPANERFNPNSATVTELRAAAKAYFGLTDAQLDKITLAEVIAIDAAWAHKASQIIVAFHQDWGGANESNLPALAKVRLASLRTGNPNYGTL